MKTALIGKNEASITNIFLNRGINPDKIYRLGPDSMLDPALIKNMESCAKVVNKAITEQTGSILIVQDPDADGYTSSAIIHNYLAECYPEIEKRLSILIHEDKAHGIPVEAVRAELDNGKNISLIIAPDCSSNEHDVHKYISEDLGVPIVILDHHDADSYSPYATMVNISLDDYPNKALAGAGVCFKFTQMYDKLYGFHNSPHYMDLATVGGISDMVSVNTYETIYIVQEGMRNIHNLFLKKLYAAKSFNLGGQITPIGISFYISPIINATTRVGTLEEKRDVAIAMMLQEEKAVPSTKRGAKNGDEEEFHESVIRRMNNIKARQDRQRDKAVEALDAQIEEGNLTENQILILDTKNEFPKTFTGLIANQFMAKYKKPTLVGSTFTSGGVDYFGGSARGDDKSDLSELKTFEQDSGLFEFAEGHEGAHGFSFQADRKNEIIDYFNKTLSDITFEPIYKLDFDIDWKDASQDLFMEIIRYCTFWGRGLEEPVFALRNVPITGSDVEVAGDFGNHRISFKSGYLKFVKFKGVDTPQAQSLKKSAQSKIDVVGTIKYSTYKGESFLQIFVSDFEVKSSQKYRF